MDALTRSRLVSLCVSGFQAPVHVIRVSMELALGASTPIAGIISRAGVGSVPADGSAEGCAAKDGEGAAARNAGAGGVNNPIATNTPAAMTHPPAAALSLPLTFGRNSRLSAPES